jgi:DnaJ-class molecular chaperone
MAKNYYHILGISYDAARGDIRAAFHELARKFHPDVTGGTSEGFLDIQEAYSVLSDPSQRRAYDRELSAARARPVRRGGIEPLIPEQRGVEPLRSREQRGDLGEISLTRSFRTYAPSFDEVFDYLWRNFSSINPPKAEGVRSLGVEVTITPEEAHFGGHARIMVPAQAVCPTCHGRGGVSMYECWRCAGEGAITGEFPVTLTVPPGIPDRYAVELSLSHLGISNCYLTVIFRIADLT